MDNGFEHRVQVHVIQSQKIAYAVLDQNLIITSYNETLLQWIEGNHANLIGRYLPEIFPELVGAEDTLLKLPDNVGEPFTLVKVQPSAAGKQQRYYNLRIEVLPESEAMLLLTLTDVTEAIGLERKLYQQRNQLRLRLVERQQAEEALRQSEERYRDLFEHATDLIQGVGPDGRFIYVNRRWCETLGYTPEEAKTLSFEDILQPDQVAHCRAIFEQLQQGESFDYIEIVFKTKAGESIPVEGNINAQIVAGEFICTRGIFRDVTRRKRAEEQLHQSNLELKMRNEELDAFAQTVAHDLKNPLNGIIGYAELLISYFSHFSPEKQLLYLNQIKQAGHKMTSIINELLLLAGVHKMTVEPKPLDMAAIVAEVQQRLAYAIEEYQAVINLPKTWPVVLGYGPWVEEVWANYVSNGLKYGGQPPQLELGATPQADGFVRFWVRDNGPGLTLAEQSKLFTTFTRLEKTQATGHGLGLSIVRRIVERLGGQVGLESAVGQGTLFYFTLPGVEGN
ncbi:MAG: PAS domain S-box protein [Anaerolineae bacterium]